LPWNKRYEEWANQHGHELEALLDAGWNRVQAVLPPYLLIDFLFPLNAAQIVAVGRLFVNQFEQIVIEFVGETTSFADAEEAMRYAVGKE
jgi:hypothetical protein